MCDEKMWGHVGARAKRHVVTAALSPSTLQDRRLLNYAKGEALLRGTPSRRCLKWSFKGCLAWVELTNIVRQHGFSEVKGDWW
jgi:hypothetical protein